MELGVLNCGSSLALLSGRPVIRASAHVALSQGPWNAGHLQRAPLWAVRGLPAGSVQGFEDDMHGMFPMEDGIFEEAFPTSHGDDDAEDDVAADERPGLIPEEWRPLQEELGRTKREKKREVLNILVERSKQKEVQRRMRREMRDAGNEAYRQRFFPRVLPDGAESRATPGGRIEDDIDAEDEFLSSESEADERAEELRNGGGAALGPPQRATPRNPRLALGESTFEEMARMLSADELIDLEPAEVPSAPYNDVESMEVSGSKLLTAKEKLLLKSTNVNFSRISSERWNPLHTLASSGQINLVNLLLRHSIDINARDKDGLTALHRASLCGRESMMRFLLKSGADVTATDKAGATVLHYATQTANSTVIKAVLRHKADINACDNEGWTPLHVAVQSGRTDIIKLLVSRGADATIQNKDGNTPLDVALSYGKGFGYYHVVKLLKKGLQSAMRSSNLDDDEDFATEREPEL